MPANKENWWLEPSHVSQKCSVSNMLFGCHLVAIMRLNFRRQIQGFPLALTRSRDPYFLLAFRRQECNGCPVADAIDLHLECERRGGTIVPNPYSNSLTAFHITFYEIIPVVETVHSMHIGDTENRRADDREKNNLEATELLIETCESNNIKISRLFEEPRAEAEDNGTRSSSIRAFRKSAFTVSVLITAFLFYPLYHGIPPIILITSSY